MSFVYLIITLFSILNSNTKPVESASAQTHLIITRVGPCGDRDRDPVNVSEMALHRELYHFSFSGWLNITEDIENGWYIKAIMQKCHDIRNLDTCDYYKSAHLIRDGCLDSEQEDIYIMFFQYMSPRLDCPIQAGFYTITDFPFFTEDTGLTAMESKISTSEFGYTYRLDGYSVDHKKLVCVEAYLRMMYLRKHDWVGDQKIHNYDSEPTTGEPSEGANTKDAEPNGNGSEDQDGMNTKDDGPQGDETGNQELEGVNTKDVGNEGQESEDRGVITKDDGPRENERNDQEGTNTKDVKTNGNESKDRQGVNTKDDRPRGDESNDQEGINTKDVVPNGDESEHQEGFNTKAVVPEGDESEDQGG